MKHRITSLFLGVGLLSIPLTTLAIEQLQTPLRVQAEVFQPKQQRYAETATALKTPAAVPLKHANHNSRPMSMELAAPDKDELAQLQQNNTRYKAFQIGIQRSVPVLPVVADWGWTPVRDGQAGSFMIVSEQASRLRALLRLQAALPDGVEIRIYTPGDDTEVHGPFTGDNFNTVNGNHEGNQGELWTPAVSGSSLGIEIFVPASVNPADIRLEIPQVSHILYDLKSQQLQGRSTDKTSHCEISIACAPQAWQQTAKSVARYIYTLQNGNSYLCSGTLMTDQDTSTQIPYFLTAAHCVGDSRAAASMDLYWLYRESVCGAGDASWVRGSGGAELLASKANLDATLVRLNDSPPAGVMLSGWSLDTLSNGEYVAGLHHAHGDIKQYSYGQFETYANINAMSGGYTTTPNPDGDFIEVTWNQGVTDLGSSGAGLWNTVGSQHFLKGTLIGGSSACSTPDAPDEYSRLERFYPFASEWLGKPVLKGILYGQNSPKPLTDGVILARYMDGVRGIDLLNGIAAANMDLAVIEARLQTAVGMLDIDGNGVTEAERDGLLLIRYLLGLRGDSLIADIELAAAPNNTAAGIADFIAAALEDSLMVISSVQTGEYTR